MEKTRIATTIMVVLLSLESGVAEIVTKPTATEVVVGGSTFLNCSTSIHQEIHWFHTPVGPTQERNFVYGYDQFYTPYIGRFQLEKNETNGAYNLVIPSVRIEDAGVYECQEETGRGSKVSAQLIVLDTNPVCEPHTDMHEIIGPNKCGIEPSQLILSCTVKYHGNEAPILEWRRASDNTLVIEGVTRGAIDNIRVVYNLTIKGNSTVKDGDSYLCNTTRSTMLNYGCKSGKIKVKGTDCPACVASEICEPFIQPYIAAVICFFLIILPTAIGGTVFVLWYLRIYRPSKREQKDNPVFNVTTTKEAATTEEMKSLKCSASSLVAGEGAKQEINEPNRHRQLQEERNNGPDIKVVTLEARINYLEGRIDRRDKTINDLRQNDESNKGKINSLQLENDQLQDKVKDLEQRLYATENTEYVKKPVLAHTIDLSEKNKAMSEKNTRKSVKNKGKLVNGITVLGTELFVVTKPSQEIEVYDSKTFQHERSMEIIGMADPLDIASSKDAKCLYVVCLLSEETESKVMRLDPKGNVLNHWLTGGKKGRLSTYETNVILCLSDKQLINEYSTEGKLVVTVRLSPAAKLNNPMHAIKVTSECFVVSHGDVTDKLRRVCVVDLGGNIMKEYTELEKSIWEKPNITLHTTMKVPICLVEDNERSIIIADRDRNRILLLSSMLKYQRRLIEEENGLKDFPFRLCFDDTQSRLFVAVNKWNPGKGEWEDGHVLVYNIK